MFDPGARKDNEIWQSLSLLRIYQNIRKNRVKKNFHFFEIIMQCSGYITAIGRAAAGSVKQEKLYRYSFESIEEVELALSEYFDYYNNRRMHQSFGYFTPANMYFG